MLERIIYLGANCPSFAAASATLAAVADLTVSAKQIERRTRAIGAERCAERDASAETYQALPLPRRKGTPTGVTPPDLAVVQMDGGRLQVLDRSQPRESSETRGRKGRHWQESKVGVLESMTSEACKIDPCPTLPAHFVDPARIAQLAWELKVNAPSKGRSPAPVIESTPPTPSAKAVEYEPPQTVLRSLVASKKTVNGFDDLLASAAWERGFFGSARRAFLGDGSTANWGVWERRFSSFTPIVDFIHVLTYVYQAAMAGGPFAEGWTRYADWIAKVWQGESGTVLAAMEARQTVVGLPEKSDGEAHPRVVLAEAVRYLRNQEGRLKYPEYRRAGLPITTSHVESAVKQMNRRVKGTEKFWSEPGAEAILQLRADALSDTEPLVDFWVRRETRLAQEPVKTPAA